MKILLPGLLTGAVTNFGLPDGERVTLPCDTSLDRNETLPARTRIELSCFDNEDEAAAALLELASNRKEFDELIRACLSVHVNTHYFKTVDCGSHSPSACETSVGSHYGIVQWGANVETFMGISYIFVYPLEDVDLSVRCKTREE